MFLGDAVTSVSFLRDFIVHPTSGQALGFRQFELDMGFGDWHEL